MGTRKKELFDKMESIKAHTAGLLVLLHGLEEKPNVHFEIGHTDAKGHTKCVYTSTSINRVLNEYSLQAYTEKDGYLVDAWEDGNPAADISTHTAKKKSAAKVMFEINKKRIADLNIYPKAGGFTSVDSELNTTFEYETVFRSTSMIECRGEWMRKMYTSETHVIDIREAPEGQESYHVADIDINSMTKEVPRKYGKDWLVSLIKNHVDGDKGKVLGIPEQLAERIMQVYGRGSA